MEHCQLSIKGKIIMQEMKLSIIKKLRNLLFVITMALHFSNRPYYCHSSSRNTSINKNCAHLLNVSQKFMEQ